MRFSLLIFLFCGFAAVGQSGSKPMGNPAGNPFELTFRLPDSALVADAASSGNPFDLVPHRLPKKLGPRREKATWVVPRVDLPTGKSRNPAFLFWAVLLPLGWLTVMVSLFRPFIGKAFRGFLNDNFLTLSFREISSIVGSPYSVFYAHFFMQAGIFAFLLMRWFSGDSFNNLPFLLLCMAAATGIFLFRHFLLVLVAWVFPVEKEVAKYHFTLTVFNILLGLVLLPANLFIAWGPPELARWLIYSMLFLFAILYLYRSLRGLAIGSKFLSSAQFHFLSYLCAVEIAPQLVLLKLLFLQAPAR